MRMRERGDAMNEQIGAWLLALASQTENVSVAHFEGRWHVYVFTEAKGHQTFRHANLITAMTLALQWLGD